MDSKQFAWLYLVESGIAGCEHSYYGGYKLVDKRMRFLDRWDKDPIKKYYLKELKQFGVNWDKTEAPTSNMISEFVGTFNADSEKEYLNGVLVLNNGSKQSWIAEGIEITNVFDMMAAIENSKNKFHEIFEL